MELKSIKRRHDSIEVIMKGDDTFYRVEYYYTDDWFYNMWDGDSWGNDIPENKGSIHAVILWVTGKWK